MENNNGFEFDNIEPYEQMFEDVNNNMEPYNHEYEDVGYNKELDYVLETSNEDGPGNGQEKCPKCGATDISPNLKNGKLRCNFCRHEFEPVTMVDDNDIGELEGIIVSKGSIDIEDGAEDIVTLKCSSCGAEVVIDTNNSMQARCHWCRNMLSINEQIPNGSVPDMVLPFDVTREEARKLIDGFVKKRRFFANPKFKKEFTSDNVMGVYFPYMVVDINAHAHFRGEAEHELRRYTVGSGDSKRTKYDAEVYEVEREFDLLVDDLTIESSADKLNKNATNKTNNIINSILPFDTENAIRWNANYLRGYTSEKRDVNIQQMQSQVEFQTKDIARFAANDTMKYYDRGANWSTQELKMKGQKWKSAHLPVWLYSYYEKKGSTGLLHYVVVNARTRETMGSVPIHKPKLFFVSAIIEFLSGYAMTRVELEEGEFIFLTAGFIFYFIMYAKYRNNSARHTHEIETRREIRNVRAIDNFIKKRKGLSDDRIKGENSNKVEGNKFK